MSGFEDAYLVRARWLVEQAIRRRWAAGLPSRDPDGVFTAFLGSDDVERILGTLAADAAPAAPAASLDDARYDPETPLGALVERLGLRATEADVLAVLLTCESDPTTARLVTYLGGNQAAFTLHADLLLDVVYRSRFRRQSEAAARLFEDLAPRRLLRRLRYVVIDGAADRSALAQGVRLHPRLAAWLLGDHAVDADLAAHCRLHAPQIPVGRCAPQHLEPAMAALRDGGRLLVVEGPRASGREMMLRFAAVALDKPLLVVNGRGLTPDQLVACFREASLRDCLLALRDTEEVLSGAGIHRFRECLDVFPSTVALLDAGRATPALLAMRPASTVRIEVPPMADREALWREHLGVADAHAADVALTPVDVAEIAALYHVGTQGIVTASDVARGAARFAREPLRRDHVTRAVRQLFDVDLSTVARRMEVSQGWEDLVLPDDIGRSIIGIVERIRFRGDVLGRWGFARKLGKGLGLTVLFSGEPGTGKSMVAGLIAKELGLDLYVVDLSQITSKWIGETEKNLARAFDAAEAGHVLLLFDEADSLLARRTSNMSSSNDRHANLETNFILARIEQFAGIAFFTTNLPSALDPAIARRMSVHVNFPFPDAHARTELWRRMIPTEAPIDGEVDWVALGARYEISGGFIRNIVLRAAYAAAGAHERIAMTHLEQAAEAEYRERGLLVIGGRLA